MIKMYIGVHVKCTLFLSNVTKLEFSRQILEKYTNVNLTFIGPCIANIFAKYNQQYATFHNLFISVRRSTCFGLFFHSSPGAQNCTYSVSYLLDQYLTLFV